MFIALFDYKTELCSIDRSHNFNNNYKLARLTFFSCLLFESCTDNGEKVRIIQLGAVWKICAYTDYKDDLFYLY